MDEHLEKFFNGHWVRQEERLTEYHTLVTAICGTDGRMSAAQMMSSWATQREKITPNVV